MNDKVAFVIVCWNNQKLLRECIESIQNQTIKNKKIIMVDNASSDDSVAFVRKHFPDVEVLPQKKNYAFAKGNNIGVTHALEEEEVQYVALVNTDATLDNHWAETIIKFADKKPKGAAFQTITLDYYNHDIIDSTHIYIAHNGQATQGSWRRPMISHADAAPQKVFGCNAAAVVFSRKFIDEQPFDEFFDESLTMYIEDVDIAARATVLGWDNYVVPGARAYHMGSASSSKNPNFALYMTFRNNSAVLMKNLPLIILLRMLPKFVRGDIDTIKVLWQTGRKSSIKSVVKGRVYGTFRSILYLKKRYIIRKYSKVDYKTLWKLMYRGY